MVQIVYITTRDVNVDLLHRRLLLSSKEDGIIYGWVEGEERDGKGGRSERGNEVSFVCGFLKDNQYATRLW